MTDVLQRLQKVLRAGIARASSTLTGSLYLHWGRRLALVSVPLLLAILVNGLLAWRNFDNVVESERIVSHTHAVQAQVEVVRTTLVDAESGQRGYLLTGDSAYLAPYDAARSNIGAEVARLRTLTARDAAQQARVSNLESLISALLAEQQRTIDLRAQQQTDEAIAAIRTGSSQQTMESIRALLAEMDAAEEILLKERISTAMDSLSAAKITMLLATLADVALLATLVALVWRTFAARERHLQTERDARATAEAAVTLRDQFFSVASHELRTPLAVLLGSLQLLERRISRTSGTDEHLHQTFAAIHRQLARLQALIATMLDVSQIDHGQLKIARDPLDIAALVRATVDEVRPTAQGHPIELVIHFDPPSAALVRGDALRLEQVLLNLLQNAIKYSPEGGPIRVDVTCGADHVSVSVADHGVGIPDDVLPHLFERFYRAPDVRSEHISGMGIGLYIVREVVALHGGTVTVASKQGKGSTFTVHLPLVAPAGSNPGEGASNNHLPTPNEPK